MLDCNMGALGNKSTALDSFQSIPKLVSNEKYDMPLYEYQCSQCNKTFEAIQKFSDSPLDVCSLCGGQPVTKLVSRTSFHLKGSGWYATDYKKSSAPSPAAPAAESAPAPAAVPAAKPEPKGGGSKE